MIHRTPTDAPLRILMMAPQYRPLVGGYERAAERLSTALAARGHRVTVVTDRRERSWPQREVRHGVIIHRLWCLFKPRLHMPTSLGSLAWFLLLQGRGFDVWHVHQYGLHAAIVIGLGRLLGRPTVLKLTSSGQHGVARALGGHPLARLATLLLKRASGVVALTRETASEAQAVGVPPSRVNELGNGVDIGAYRPRCEAERAALKVELGIDALHVFICVGRLAPDKNLDGLLSAWDRAVPELPPGWKLVIVGEGPAREALEIKIAKLEFGSTIRMVGEQQQVEQWLGAADVYVSSSNREGLSNTLLEAMASGLPSVVTRVSGATQLVEEAFAGLVVEVGDMEAMAAAMVDLASDIEIQARMSEAARRKVERSYSIDAVTDGHEKLYRKLLLEYSH